MQAHRELGIVTGAASGIRKAVVERMRNAAVEVLAVDRDPAALGKMQEPGIRTLVADLATVEGRDDVVARSDGCRYLVNSAGVSPLGAIFAVTIQDLRDIYAVNMEAIWDLTSRIGSAMTAGGAIVNLGSSTAKLATTTEGAAYAEVALPQ